jgi:hypothetical protein
MAATCIEFSKLDYATPSGFLNLLTFYSASVLSVLFHTDSILEVEAFRGFPLPVAATAHAALCPPSIEMLRGLLHREDPFTIKRFYPDFIGRSSLSLLSLRGFSPLILGVTEK